MNPYDHPQDAAEVWGKRAGRGLAVIAAIGLLLYFVWGLA
jgi:hypothetical protein